MAAPAGAAQPGQLAVAASWPPWPASGDNYGWAAADSPLSGHQTARRSETDTKRPEIVLGARLSGRPAGKQTGRAAPFVRAIYRRRRRRRRRRRCCCCCCCRSRCCCSRRFAVVVFGSGAALFRTISTAAPREMRPIPSAAPRRQTNKAHRRRTLARPTWLNVIYFGNTFACRLLFRVRASSGQAVWAEPSQGRAKAADRERTKSFYITRAVRLVPLRSADRMAAAPVRRPTCAAAPDRRAAAAAHYETLNWPLSARDHQVAPSALPAAPPGGVLERPMFVAVVVVVVAVFSVIVTHAHRQTNN
jgi:hypothetical protein